MMALMTAGPVAGIPFAHAQNQAPAQEEPKTDAPEDKDKTLDKAGNIASQPARDVGIAKTKIPPVLTEAVKNPYAPPSGRKCAAIIADMTALNDALGPDFGDSEEENENRAGKIAEAGGKMIVNSLIPFRGLVREVTGAAPAERRLQAAIGAGLARRGYLRGLATARNCKMPG
ncbi:MAG: hypothetical protein AB7E05_04825 [Sphingobium sp.]